MSAEQLATAVFERATESLRGSLDDLTPEQRRVMRKAAKALADAALDRMRGRELTDAGAAQLRAVRLNVESAVHVLAARALSEAIEAALSTALAAVRRGFGN